jgi:hypothetical protein
MTRAKQKRAGTKSGRRNLPDDLPDAAEAALDDLLRVDVDDDDIEDEILTQHAGAAYEDRTMRRNKVAEPELSESGTMPIDALEDDELDGDEVVTELPVLRVGVFEDAINLRSLQSAIGAAGHVVAIAGTGPEGRGHVLAAVREPAVAAAADRRARFVAAVVIDEAAACGGEVTVRAAIRAGRELELRIRVRRSGEQHDDEQR